jgi:AraC-like DNA-binding protein
VLYDVFTEVTDAKWEKKWVRRLVEPREAFPLMIRYAGAARWPEGMEVVRNESDLFAIEYVCAGNAVLVQENKQYVINKGSVFLLREQVDHVYGVGPAGILFKRFVTIDGYDLDNLLRYLRLRDKDYIVPAEPWRINALLKRCMTLLSKPPAFGLDIELSTIAYQLLLVLSMSTRTSYPDKIERVLELMHENLHKSLTRKELADHINTSTVHLNRIFAEHLHRSPMSYFMDLKMSWAANLFESTSMSAKEISYKIGIENQFYFSSLFKKHFGVSPKAYRVLKRK